MTPLLEIVMVVLRSSSFTKEEQEKRTELGKKKQFASLFFFNPLVAPSLGKIMRALKILVL